jgi:hypothetical protein
MRGAVYVMDGPHLGLINYPPLHNFPLDIELYTKEKFLELHKNMWSVLVGTN